MAKFHINKNGVPAVCRAVKGNCPYGGADGTENHYDSHEEAEAAANKENSESFGVIAHPEGNAGRRIDTAVSDMFGSGYGEGNMNYSALDEYVIGDEEGKVFELDSHPRPEVVSHYMRVMNNQHNRGYRYDAVQELDEYYAEEMKDPETAYELITKAQAMNESFEKGEKLANKLAEETKRIAKEEGLSGEDYDRLVDYTGDKLSESLHYKDTTIIGGTSDIAHGSQPNQSHNLVHDSRIPTFYKINDDVMDRMNESVEVSGPEMYGHASWNTLTEREKFEFVADNFDKGDFKDEYNSTYSEKDFDSMFDKMANHYSVHSVASVSDAEARVKEIGKEKFYREFNDFVFDRKKPTFS